MLKSFQFQKIGKMVLVSIVFGILLYLCVGCVAMRTWKYEILTTTAKSSDEGLLNASIHIDQNSFVKTSVSSTFDLKFDTDDTTMIAITGFHGVSGRDEDYRELLYQVPKMTLAEFVNNYWNEMVYPNLGPCSNFPKFEGTFVSPFPRKSYILNHCEFTGDGFPDILPIGYYKIWIQMSGQVELNVVLILKLTAKYV